MLRIALFLATNLGIIIILSISMRLLGIDSMLEQSGNLNLYALLGYSAMFGIGGAFISLAISKWIAYKCMRVHVIE